MEFENGVQRWVVDISNWKPSDEDFTMALALLPRHEHHSVTRFLKLEDRKRAVISRMLQYALVHHVLNLPFEAIAIRRTPQGKPFLVSECMKLGFPNFNFNVSHQGNYVGIASEPLCLVGLDIVSYSLPVNESVYGFLQNFSPYFSQLEWCNILNACSDDEKLKTFYRYWSLKEAFVKAVGTGVVDCKLDSIEFHHTSSWEDISVRVAGEDLSDWKFWNFELDQCHGVSIARGNPKLAKSNLSRRAVFDSEEYNTSFNLPNKSLKFLSVEDLIELMHPIFD